MRFAFVLLATLSSFAQTVRQEGPNSGYATVKTSAAPPSTGESPQIEWPKSAVTVVFAPDLRQAPQAERSARVDTVESWMRSPALAGLARDLGKPVEFAAPRGAVGVRVGAESLIGTAIIIGDDGKRHFECGRLPEALAKIYPTASANSARVVNDK